MLANEDARRMSEKTALRLTADALSGEVVKLDRGYPLVRLANGDEVRCEQATALVKTDHRRAVIGDRVNVSIPAGHDKGIIESIEPRTREFVRKDPTDRAQAQVLAANFDQVIVAQPVTELNMRRLERELVLAFETGAAVAVVLTKADLADETSSIDEVREAVCDLAGADVDVFVVSESDQASVEAVRRRLEPGTMTVLLGRSGVGKSTLVNLLIGKELQETGAVREGDGKGRHTTVSREIIDIPQAGRVVDMPGVRGLGLWDADEGIDAAFSDIAEAAQACRFRDCKHENEPGCAVREAVERGDISQVRFDSYKALCQETADVRQRREQARWATADRGRARKADMKKSDAKKRMQGNDASDGKARKGSQRRRAKG